MRQQSQRDNAWKNVKLGTSNYTLGSQGCVVTSLANMIDRTPVEVNQILRYNNGFKNGCLIIWQRAADLLGLRYDSNNGALKFFPCLGETMITANQQHFFIMLDPVTIIDPLDGRIKVNPYKIRSYRNIGPKIAPTPPPVTPPPPPPAAAWPRLVRVTGAANVRSQPKVSAQLSGSKTLKVGETFTGVELVNGDSVGGNNRWVKSSKGNFVWSGNLNY
jgi:hypothetical protein